MYRQQGSCNIGAGIEICEDVLQFVQSILSLRQQNVTLIEVEGKEESSDRDVKLSQEPVTENEAVRSTREEMEEDYIGMAEEERECCRVIAQVEEELEEAQSSALDWKRNYLSHLNSLVTMEYPGKPHYLSSSTRLQLNHNQSFPSFVWLYISLGLVLYLYILYLPLYIFYLSLFISRYRSLYSLSASLYLLSISIYLSLSISISIELSLCLHSTRKIFKLFCFLQLFFLFS